MDGYYDAIAAGYENLHWEEQENKYGLIKARLAIKPEDRILDVGCGTCRGLMMFSCQRYGLDPSIGLLNLCKDKNIITSNSSAEAIPFKDHYFDHVISVTAVHNFKDVKKGLEEIKRVGKHSFAISILKKANSFNIIERWINTIFSIKEKVDEKKDIIFFCN